MTDVRVFVAGDEREYGPAVLRAGHRVIKTLYDVGAQTMTLWVEKGEGYVEPYAPVRYATSGPEDIDFPGWE